MKKIFLLLCIFSISFFAQGHKFAWIIDSKISSDIENSTLETIINSINENPEISFTLISGSITSKGKTEEIDLAKSIFDKLLKPYHIIPGKNDNKYCFDGGMYFRETWEEEKFSFLKDTTLYIGVTTSLYYNSNLGHISYENLSWLAEEMDEMPEGRDVIFISNDPFNQSWDNFAKATNLFAGKNLSVHLFDNGPYGKATNFQGIKEFTGVPVKYSNGKEGGYTIVTNRENKLNFESILIKRKDKTVLDINKSLVSPVKNIPYQVFENTAAKILWDKKIQFSLSAPPVEYNNRIFVADKSGLVTAISIKGQTLWEYDVFGDIISRPAAADGVLAVATTQGDLSTIQIKSGESVQTIGFDETLATPLVIFDYTGQKRRMIPKNTKSKAAVLVGSVEGILHCIDLETMEELWRSIDAKGALTSCPIVEDNKVIYSSHDGYLYCVDAREGWLVWKWKPDTKKEYSIGFSNPITDGKNIYITSTHGYIFSIDLKLGKKNWESQKYKVWHSLGMNEAKTKLYIKSRSDNFHVVSAANGKYIKTVDMKYGYDKSTSVPVNVNSIIIAPAQNGFLYRLNSNYNYKTLIKFEPAPLHTVVPLSGQQYVASDIDGNIVLFHYSEK